MNIDYQSQQIRATCKTVAHAKSAIKKQPFNLQFSTSVFFLIILTLTLLSGCSTYSHTQNNTIKTPSKPVFVVTEKGHKCGDLNSEIKDTLAYAKKFKHSQYAHMYQAMMREKLFSIEGRARLAKCIYTPNSSQTRLHNLTSL